jgi:hypothetical protein
MFQPSPDAREAHRFLRTCPPWSGQRHRPGAGLVEEDRRCRWRHVGADAVHPGADALLDFSVALTLDSEAISDAVASDSAGVDGLPSCGEVGELTGLRRSSPLGGAPCGARPVLPGASASWPGRP